MADSSHSPEPAPARARLLAVLLLATLASTLAVAPGVHANQDTPATILPITWHRHLGEFSGTGTFNVPGYPDLTGRIFNNTSPATAEAVPHGGLFDATRYIEITATYHTVGQLTTQQRTFQVDVDGEDLQGCAWRIGQSSGADRRTQTIRMNCHVGPTDGTRTYNITGTGNTGFIDHVSYSIVLHGRELIMLDVNLNTAFDQWIPVLFWGGLMLLGVWRTAVAGIRWIFVPIFAYIALIVSVLPAFEDHTFTFAPAVFVVATCLWFILLARAFGLASNQRRDI